jgi:hypothetical protein
MTGIDIATEVARHHINAAGRRVYSFDCQGRSIENPAMDATQSRVVSPQEYGFTVKEFAGGRTAWTRSFANGTMMALNPQTKQHDLRGAEAVRIMFVSPQGELLQDSRLRLGARPQTQEVAHVRVTVNVAVDLLGATPEVAKTAVLRQIGRSLSVGAIGNGAVEVLQHSFELSEIVTESHTDHDYSNTNFSQLLGS